MLLKVRCNEETHLLNKKVNYYELKHFIHGVFKNYPSTYNLTYLDSEGDEITISNDHDLETLFKTATGGVTNVIVREGAEGETDGKEVEKEKEKEVGETKAEESLQTTVTRNKNDGIQEGVKSPLEETKQVQDTPSTQKAEIIKDLSDDLSSKNTPQTEKAEIIRDSVDNKESLKKDIDTKHDDSSDQDLIERDYNKMAPSWKTLFKPENKNQTSIFDQGYDFISRALMENLDKHSENKEGKAEIGVEKNEKQEKKEKGNQKQPVAEKLVKQDKQAKIEEKKSKRQLKKEMKKEQEKKKPESKDKDQKVDCKALDILILERLDVLTPEIKDKIMKVLRQEKVEESGQVHRVQCKVCLVESIKGIRYKCVVCPDYNLCSLCEDNTVHPHDLIKMRRSNKSPQKRPSPLVKRQSPMRQNSPNQLLKPNPKPQEKPQYKQKAVDPVTLNLIMNNVKEVVGDSKEVEDFVYKHYSQGTDKIVDMWFNKQ